MMDTAAFVAAAEAMIGTPFKHQGRLPGVGLDCAGLVVCALRAVGYPVIDAPPGYGRLPSHGMLERVVESNCDRIALADLADGDLCTFRFRNEPQHLAIHVGGGQLIHCWQDAGRVLCHDFDALWRDRLVACYRLKGAA